MDIETPPPAQLLQALAGREAMLRALFDNPLCAIIVTNVAGVIQSASAAALDRLGVELEAVIGQPLETFVTPLDDGGDGPVNAVLLKRPDGEARARFSAASLPDGLHVGVLADAVDETKTD